MEAGKDAETHHGNGDTTIYALPPWSIDLIKSLWGQLPLIAFLLPGVIQYLNLRLHGLLQGLWLAPWYIQLSVCSLLGPFVLTGAIMMAMQYIFYAIAGLLVRMPKVEMFVCRPERRVNGGDHSTCSICWADIMLEEMVSLHEYCNNTFHHECLRSWMSVCAPGKQLCPICRNPASSSAEELKPDGRAGHTWRLAVFDVIRKQTWLVFLISYTLAVTSTGSFELWAMSSSDQSPLKGDAELWLCSAIQMEISRQLLRNCNHISREPRVFLWIFLLVGLQAGMKDTLIFAGHVRLLWVLASNRVIEVNSNRGYILH